MCKRGTECYQRHNKLHVWVCIYSIDDMVDDCTEQSVDCIGLWSCLVLLSIIRAPLYLRSSCCYVHSKFFWLHLFLYLLVSWAWWDWPLTWLTNRCPSVLWHCWLVILPVKSSPKWPSGMLNPTIPHHTLQSSPPVCTFIKIIDVWMFTILRCNAYNISSSYYTFQIL